LYEIQRSFSIVIKSYHNNDATAVTTVEGFKDLRELKNLINIRLIQAEGSVGYLWV